MTWDGTAVTVPTRLATVANVKEYLDISSSDDDTLFGNLLDRVTDAIQSHCNRTFAQTTHTEYHDGRGASQVVLKHRPIVSVTSVHDDLDRDFAASSLISASDYITRDDEGIIEWLSSNSTFPSTAAYFYDGQLNVKVIYVAGYANIPDDVIQAACMMTALLYHRGKQGADGIASENQAGAYNVVYVKGVMTPEIKQLLAKFRDYKI